MNKAKPSPSIALTILAVIALALIFAEYQTCGRYHPDPYVSPCQDSFASALFPNPVGYVTLTHSATFTVAANVFFIAAVWLMPWFRKRSWGRTVWSVAAYVLLSVIFEFLVLYITFSRGFLA